MSCSVRLFTECWHWRSVENDVLPELVVVVVGFFSFSLSLSLFFFFFFFFFFTFYMCPALSDYSQNVSLGGLLRMTYCRNRSAVWPPSVAVPGNCRVWGLILSACAGCPVLIVPGRWCAITVGSPAKYWPCHDVAVSCEILAVSRFVSIVLPNTGRVTMLLCPAKY